MNIGASTVHGLNRDTVEVVKELHELGVPSVELVDEFARLETSPSRMKEFGVSYSAHCPLYPVSFVDMDPDVRKFARKHTEKSLTRMRRFDVEEYVLHGGWFPSYLARIDKGLDLSQLLEGFVKEVGPLVRLAGDLGMKVVMENLDPSRVGGRISDITFVQGSLPEVGFCYDISHAELYNQRDEALKMKVDHLHVQDSSLRSDDHLALGRGKVEVKAILSELTRKGYNGKFIVENLRLEDVKTSLSWLRSNMT